MKELNEILLGEIEEFRKLGHDFLDGKVSKVDFKGASGGMGVYAHRSGKEFMIRLRIPSGIASRKDLELIRDFARRYELDSVHLTTRQAIQLHGISIDTVCDIMEEGIRNGLYSRGAGGNFPRNVAISPLSGVDKNEAFDVSPYAEAVGKHFLKKIYTYKFPRKLKVAFSNNADDIGHATIADLGFLAIKENEHEYFKVFIGGGLGRNPKVAATFIELAEPKDVLYHVEAMTRLFINEGDYKNKAKARIRYILERMGEEEFIRCYSKYLSEVKSEEKLDLEIDKKAYTKHGIETTVKNKRLISQKQNGLYSVYVHPVGGQLSIKDLEDILKETSNIEDVEIRLSMSEGFYIRNLNGNEAERILEITEHIGGNTRLEYSTACIGVPTCQIGLLESQATLRNIIDYFKKMKFEYDVLPAVHISGCPNSCSCHEISGIGFCGKKKRVSEEVKDVFELYLKGKLKSGATRLGDYYGDVLKEEVPYLLYDIAKIVHESGEEFYNWVESNDEKLKSIVNKYLV
ncbi:ferredoxin-nitrite reductase [Clostridium acetobutylicum]|uniref:Ferredoxin-nitrite reductase n=1 Tax=Clostridium acetobutylicum (strain ATCC 824 / DSM 792 / JCM 1419 / IAM 19013 / LMG 5710 / NBRC 13948 / NRRL B-527 / VKM B-1787 / 2291 / W) TaxID=272562 RepID=Q97MU7_CLOAB|nr:MULTISPECIES: nitrite/sulfite reductase [Clostridium]AAK78079.1 Ferredoxin-nitrite reductase [Clostridium acetobutylicum ATCC 824]ADZ19138.1 Ferredoxin-nitrite reductase [Clostridium acetobutylicum EA 2018]AEI33702.1 ferredoxin-nitrite reductase [Clostridium acetobutylicum DSM 1731]AWV81858.1 nitrite/sulfite reductase [Clostridium acetobutylicum]MBC2395406.1 nitrite/sulfite reductase [Clostridium acetobutylicum]